MDVLEKRNFSCPYQELKSGSSKPQPIHYTNYDILALPLSNSFNYSCSDKLSSTFSEFLNIVSLSVNPQEKEEEERKRGVSCILKHKLLTFALFFSTLPKNREYYLQ
jgi:hypothetical protein